MKNIIFIAPPAAGKGTQSKILNEKYGIPHISTGNLLREEINKKTDLGNLLALKMQDGSLVSDEIVLKLLEERLLQSDTSSGFVIDGFPRNINQAESLDKLLKKMNKKIDYVIVLNLDKEEAKNRIIGRMICSKCGSVYNHLFDEMKPHNDGICDYDNELLVKRIDDNEKIFENRFNTYLKQTNPLIEYYEKKGLVHHVNSGISKEYTSSQIDSILKEGSNFNDKY